MAVKPFTTIELDPGSMVSSPVRSLGGILRVGAITPGTLPTAYYPEYARWIYVGVTGNIQYVTYDGTQVTLTNVLAGIWHPILSIAVLSAGTTASGLFWGS